MNFRCFSCQQIVSAHDRAKVAWIAGRFVGGKRAARQVMVLHDECVHPVAERAAEGHYGDPSEVASIGLTAFDGSGHRVAAVRLWNEFRQADVLRLREIDAARLRVVQIQKSATLSRAWRSIKALVLP